MYTKPQWEDKDHEFDAGAWDFLVSRASYDHSNKLLLDMPNGQELLGDSSGRGIWVENTDPDRKKRIVTFNPSKNPNASDLVLRGHLRKEEVAADKPLKVRSIVLSYLFCWFVFQQIYFSDIINCRRSMRVSMIVSEKQLAIGRAS